MDIPTSSKPDSEMTRRHSEGRDVENVENKESSKSSRPRSKSLELKKKRSRLVGDGMGWDGVLILDERCGIIDIGFTLTFSF